MPAWMLARTYHLAMMPGAGRRARLLVDWNIGLLFGRDTAELGRIGEPRTRAAADAPAAAPGANGATTNAGVTAAGDGAPTGR
jgi:NADH dehydrogenase